MIRLLSDTTSREIAAELTRMREDVGQLTSGRVLTFLVIAHGTEETERAIDAARAASVEHPARAIIIGLNGPTSETRLNAKLLIGGAAGASEILVLHLSGEMTRHPASVITPLLLPDTPIVAWWPGQCPADPSATPLGRIAQRCITDSTGEGLAAILDRREHYHPGDTDLCWSRITSWRGLMAATLEQPPYEPITAATVWGPECDPAVDLAAGWLADRLGVKVRRGYSERTSSDGSQLLGVHKAQLQRGDSLIEVEIDNRHTATVRTAVDRADQQVALAQRTTADCIAEELRHLDVDAAYARALKALDRVTQDRAV